jgi:hypothetical protein
VISRSSGIYSDSRASSPADKQGPKIVPYVASDFEEVKHQDIELEFSYHKTASPIKEGGEYEHQVASDNPS